MVAVDELMTDYVHQLRRHTSGRRAIHIKLSGLEREFHQSTYKKSMATILKALVSKYKGEMYALPSDMIAFTLDATAADIQKSVEKLHTTFAESGFVSGIQAEAGVSDAFITWFDVEKDYPALVTRVQSLADGVDDPTIAVERSTTAISKKASVGAKRFSSAGNDDGAVQLKNKKYVRKIAIQHPKDVVDEKALTPEIMLQIYQAVKTTDIGALIRTETVAAITGDAPPTPILAHRYIAFNDLLHVLVPDIEAHPDKWLYGYLMNFVCDRVVASKPNMDSKEAMLSSLQMPLDTVFKPEFDKFNKSIVGTSRSHIVLEFDVGEGMQFPTRFASALNKIKDLGYKACLRGIDPRAFLWMDMSVIDVEFVKLINPVHRAALWDSTDFKLSLKTAFARLDGVQIILEGVDDKAVVTKASAAGIYLFQGKVTAS